MTSAQELRITVSPTMRAQSERSVIMTLVRSSSRLRSSVLAHEVRPAYLELRQTGTDTYDVLWKVPARGDNMRLGIYVEFPSGTTNVTTPRTLFANDASTERWSIKRPGGLTGDEIQYYRSCRYYDRRAGAD